jgi:hypothetical protein
VSPGRSGYPRVGAHKLRVRRERIQRLGESRNEALLARACLFARDPPAVFGHLPSNLSQRLVVEQRYLHRQQRHLVVVRYAVAGSACASRRALADRRRDLHNQQEGLVMSAVVPPPQGPEASAPAAPAARAARLCRWFSASPPTGSPSPRSSSRCAGDTGCSASSRSSSARLGASRSRTAGRTVAGWQRPVSSSASSAWPRGHTHHRGASQQ